MFFYYFTFILIRSFWAFYFYVAGCYFQVIFWKGRVDRACIERMKAFQNPPVLVGQVMEMVMLLVGKRLPTHPPKMERDQSAGYPVRDEQSGRYSTNSSNSTRLAMSKKGMV